MPRAVSPDTLLVSFSEAARLLSVDVATVRRLVAQGHVRAHPILISRITRKELESFVQFNDAEADIENGRSVDAATAAGPWQVPPMRLRTHSG